MNTVTGNFYRQFIKYQKKRLRRCHLHREAAPDLLPPVRTTTLSAIIPPDKRGKIYNAFLVQSKNDVTLTFDINNGGNLCYNDNFAALAGETNTYNLNILGYGTGKFMMNNYIAERRKVDVDNAMLVFNQAPYKDDDGCGEACRSQLSPV